MDSYILLPSHSGDFDRNYWQIREVVRLSRGRHELHFGGEIYNLGAPVQNTFEQTGQFTFSLAVTGSNLADFILGDGANLIRVARVINSGGFCCLKSHCRRWV